jgi:hypothetical protein
MSVIISIAIFFLGSYVLAFPQSQIISKKRYQLVDEQNAYSLNIFSKIDEEGLTLLRNTGCKVENGTITCSPTVQEGEPLIFDVKNEDKNAHIYLVFDLYDVTDSQATPKYNINEQFNKKTDFIQGDEYYLLVFYLDRLHYQAPDHAKQFQYTTEVDLDLTTIDNGKLISYRIMDLYIPEIKSQNSFNTFISCVIYTFLIILILWVFFKTTGSLFTLKEFYNIGAIASIVPLALIFTLSWLLPGLTLMFYFSSVFGVYYLIMILLINNKTKIA